MQASKDRDERVPPDYDDAQNDMSPTDDENSDHDEKHGGLPIDRGWAWVVFAGVVLYMFMFGGVRKNFGIFFVAFQSQYHSSASLTSLLTTTQNIVLSFAGLIVMTAGLQAISNRTSVMTGATLITTSYVITAYATDIRVLFLSYGIIEAIGIAMVHNPIIATLSEYFDKRRAMVNGLAFGGASIGGLVFAPINSSLFEHYGYTGTLMIVAGIMFHVTITGAVLRPVSSFKRHGITTLSTCETGKSQEQQGPLVKLTSESIAKGKSLNTESELVEVTYSSDIAVDVVHGQMIGNSHARRNAFHDGADMLDNHVSECKSIPSHVIDPVMYLKEDSSMKAILMSTNSLEEPKLSNRRADSPLLLRPRAWSTGKHRSVPNATQKTGLNSLVETISHSSVAFYGSANEFMGSVGSFIQISKEKQHADEDSKFSLDTKQKSCCLTFKRGIRKLLNLFDLSLFKLPVFRAFLLLSFFSQSGSVAVIVFLAPHAKDVGMTSDQIGLLMSIVGGGELCSRLVVAFISDRNWMKRTTILAIAFTTVGVAAHCSRFYNSFPAMAFFAVVVGMTCGLYMSVYALIIVEFLNMDNLRSCLGFAMMCHGIAGAVIYPLAGIIRDKTGSYVDAYHFLGSIMLTAAAMSLLLPYIHKWQQKRTSQKNET